jgi:hypothetical protein
MKERKGNERKRKERQGKEVALGTFARGTNDVELGLPYTCLEWVESPRLLLTNGVQPQGCAPGAVPKYLLFPRLERCLRKKRLWHVHEA